ncbi:hypothetical protein FOXG_20027 [Fusarium oxysporum f. sp. lycopersici 4287]|uniref:Uncharacterized protein n=2 Tax=Fusarium oxysporum TaxID=5507 RepID=A0A0J9WP50_FUSO4|nr:hypothetical protein FOXG_20027 [Fusarium oxysporum f. sp. lycopersici 4287]EXK37352.1 hypothetical protein FOMG_08132 [Fusarium oxysporum f. sp. melonis 26406]KNB08417.1 hypothetical protein FOXG_20027 [Fusarium oxysporum f. sp. lycopersici 4287]
MSSMHDIASRSLFDFSTYNEPMLSYAIETVSMNKTSHG